jgi:Toprim-like
MSEKLSLSELERFDPNPKNFGNEKRFLCPFCGEGKPRDAAHKSLATNSLNGAWKCHRCNQSGLLQEWWTKQTSARSNKPKIDPLQALRNKLAAGKEPLKAVIEPNNKPSILAKYQEYVAAFDFSPAAKYLLSRGISEDVAKVAGCGYAAKWEHWEKDGEDWKYKGCDRRVVFPIRDQHGNLVAIQGRAIDKEVPKELKVITRGQKSKGVFSTTGSIEMQKPIVAEAPIDALSFAQAGWHAMATCGTDVQEWFIKYCAFKTVGEAFDADEAGDKAAENLSVKLQQNGAKPIRLRPEGGKDWNDCLMTKGVSFVKAEVSKILGIKLESVDDERICLSGEKALISKEVFRQSVEQAKEWLFSYTLETLPKEMMLPDGSVCDLSRQIFNLLKKDNYNLLKENVLDNTNFDTLEELTLLVAHVKYYLARS